MNLEALILFFALLGGLLAITIFFYGGQILLRRLETPASQKALARFTAQTAPDFADTADAILAIDRFDDDGGNQEMRQSKVAASAEPARNDRKVDQYRRTGIRE